jgi:hypothetical protein
MSHATQIRIALHVRKKQKSIAPGENRHAACGEIPDERVGEERSGRYALFNEPDGQRIVAEALPLP